MIDVSAVSPGYAPFGVPTLAYIYDYGNIFDLTVGWPEPNGDIRRCDLEFTCPTEVKSPFSSPFKTPTMLTGEK